MEKVTYTKLYRTTDFEEALILVSANATLDEVEWDDRGEVGTFLFEDETKCKSILERHKRKNLNLLSRDVLFAYRTVKTELYKAR